MKKTRVFGRIYPPDWFEYISFRKPVCLIHSDRKWKDMSTWKENEREHMQKEREWMQNKRNMKGNECNMKAKRRKSMRNEKTWMQHARNTKGNERKMKGNLMEMKGNYDICWLSAKDAFTPTESWKSTVLVTSELRSVDLSVVPGRLRKEKAIINQPYGSEW